MTGKYFCAGCGACLTVCPRQAISLVKKGGCYAPKKNLKKCAHCSLCAQACSRNSLDLSSLEKKIFGGKPRDLFLGHYLKCYLGHAANTETRLKGASGGIATALLLSLLDGGKIDGAIVTKMDALSPLTPKVLLAKTKAEILAATSSKYCPVPLNAVFAQSKPSSERLAIVGLPCHIQGLRKMEAGQKDLAKKIVLRIGLFCANTVNFKGTEFLLRRIFKIQPRDVLKIEYRSKGWPGGMSLKLKNGQEKFFPADFYQKYLFLPWFMPPACYFCSDMTNELADLSLGDAWLPDFRKEKQGESIIITRTRKGEALLAQAVAQGKLKIKPLAADQILKAQKAPLYFKKKRLSGRLGLMRHLHNIGWKNTQLPPPRFTDYIAAFFTYLHLRAALNQNNQKIFNLIPLSCLRFYRLCFGLANYTSRKDIIFRLSHLITKRRG